MRLQRDVIGILIMFGDSSRDRKWVAIIRNQRLLAIQSIRVVVGGIGIPSEAAIFCRV